MSRERRNSSPPGLLNDAAQRAGALGSAAATDPEPTILDDLEALWAAGEHALVAQSVWVFVYLEGVESHSMLSSWLAEPWLDGLVGSAVRRALVCPKPERDDVVERLLHESSAAHLELLVARAEKECAALRTDMADTYGRLREFVAEHDHYRPAAEVLSFMLIDLGMFDDELDEIEAARDNALARCRHAALRSLLEGSVNAMQQTRFAEDQDALKGRVATLLHDDGLPLRFPDSEWENCRTLAEGFRSTILERPSTVVPACLARRALPHACTCEGRQNETRGRQTLVGAQLTYCIVRRRCMTPQNRR